MKGKRAWEIGAAAVLLLVILGAVGSLLYRQHLNDSLVAAVWRGDVTVARSLLVRGADPNAREKGYGLPILGLAADQGHSELVQLLLDRGANVNARATKGGDTALTEAAYGGHSQAIRLLLDRGAEVEASNDAGYTALIIAAWQGHPESVRLLLQHGADVSAKGQRGTALDMAKSSLYLTERNADRRETVRLLSEQLGLREGTPDTLQPIGEKR